MKKKRIKLVLIAAISFFVAYNSVYFRSLSKVKAEARTAIFDPAVYAEKFWEDEIVAGLHKAIAMEELLTKLKIDKSSAFNDHSHALGIGNIRYFLVKGEGKVVAVNENDVNILIDKSVDKTTLKLATEFIYGNAVRDAPGVININDFNSTMDLNKVSEEINKIIKDRVIPPFKEKVKRGSTVEFVGAIELNQQFLNLDKIEVVPIALTINTIQ